MRTLWLVVVSFGVGCAPPEHRWSETATRCEVLDQGCADALFADFGVDLATFPPVDPVADATLALRGAPWEEAPLGWVLVALHQLHSDSAGGPEDLWGTPLLHPDLARDLRPYRDRGSAQEVFYDLSADAITRIRLSDRRDDLLGHYRFDGVVSLFWHGGHYAPEELASTILHEARHATGPNHVGCPDHREACDVDLSGSFGVEFVYGMLRARHTDRSEELAWDAYGAVLQPAF